MSLSYIVMEYLLLVTLALIAGMTVFLVAAGAMVTEEGVARAIKLVSAIARMVGRIVRLLQAIIFPKPQHNP